LRRGSINEEEHMPVKTKKGEPAKVPPPARRGSAGVGPFRAVERFAGDVTRVSDDLGLGLMGGSRSCCG
jgi:hypothetical protein